MSGWLETLAGLAPTIATALGGPFAGLAVKTAERALGVGQGDGSDGAIKAAVATGDPTIYAQMQQAEIEFRQHLEDLGIERERLAYADTASARKMQTQTKSRLVPLLAILAVIGSMGFAGAVLMGYARVDGALAGTLVGWVMNDAKQVFAFYFGSSAGSKSKDETVATIAQKEAH